MDDVQPEVDEPQAGEPQIEEPDTAAGEAEGESKETPDEADVTAEFEGDQQIVFNREMRRKSRRVSEERTRADIAERKLQQIEASQPKPEAPDVPPMPDPELAHDDPVKYNADIAVRDKALTERAKFDDRQEAKRQFGERQAFEQQQKQDAATRQTFDKYLATGNSFGIDREKAMQDAATVGQSLRNADVQDFIADDPQGPLITNYLVGNSVELDLISRMSPMQAADYIATKVRPKLSGARQSSTAPKPPGIVDGSGTPAKERGPKGAKFE